MMRYLLFASFLLTWSAVCGSNTSSRAAQQEGNRYLRMAAAPGVSAFQKKAYEQLAALPREPLTGTFGVRPGRWVRFIYDVPSWSGPDPLEPNHPMAILYRMGIEAIPVLVEALDDTTPTASVSYSSRPLTFKPDGIIKTWKVKELVIELISAIAEREFTLTDEEVKKETRGPALTKKIVLRWYEENRHRTPAERKISDVNDHFNMNRLNAMQWLGEHKEKAGLKPVMDHIDALFASKMQYPDMQSDLSESALALGRIGDRSALQHVRRVCKYFAAKQSEEHRYGLDALFEAYRGLTLLGEKEEALRDLRQVFETCYCDQQPATQDEFKRKLQAAEKGRWGPFADWPGYEEWRQRSLNSASSEAEKAPGLPAPSR